MSKNRSGPGGTPAPTRLAISPVGVQATAESAALSTLSVSPVAINDLMVLYVYQGANAGTPCSGVSGGGVTTWYHAATTFSLYGNMTLDMFIGVVTNSGPSTITIGTITSGFLNILTAQEFSAGAGAKWYWYGAAGAGQVGPAGSTGEWDTFYYISLQPQGDNELYVGYLGAGGLIASPIFTGGFTYQTDIQSVAMLAYLTPVSNPGIYIPSFRNDSPYTTNAWAVLGQLIYATN